MGWLRLKSISAVDHNVEDSYIDGLIQVATDEAQTFTARQLITATYAYTLDRFEKVIRLPRPPLVSVTSIQYVDTNGVTQTLAPSVYTVISDKEVAEIVEADSQCWPNTKEVPNAVTITYLAGYGTNAGSVPVNIRHAIKAMVMDLYENRGSKTELRLTDNDVVDRLLWPYRVSLFA